MKTILIRSVALIAACGWAGSASGGFLAYGGYSIRGDIGDTAGHKSHVFYATPSSGPGSLESSNPRTGISSTKMLGTDLGDSTTVGDVTVRSQPGQLGIYASAGAVASNPAGPSFSTGAETFVVAYAGLADDWTFHLRHPVSRIGVDASFELDSSLITDAHGLLSTGANLGRDHVDTAASIILHIRGDGIPNGPFNAHSLD